jgi:hypothetical protein
MVWKLNHTSTEPAQICLSTQFKLNPFEFEKKKKLNPFDTFISPTKTKPVDLSTQTELNLAPTRGLKPFS